MYFLYLYAVFIICLNLADNFCVLIELFSLDCRFLTNCRQLPAGSIHDIQLYCGMLSQKVKRLND